MRVCRCDRPLVMEDGRCLKCGREREHRVEVSMDRVRDAIAEAALGRSFVDGLRGRRKKD